MPRLSSLAVSSCCAAVVFCIATAAAAETASVRTETDYRGWGWDSVVMENGLITLATVPAIGARVMQYDLSTHASMFVNEAEVGKIHPPAADAPWRNYGGYKVWPAPQDAWGWPPPPTLDGGPYEAEVVTDTPDSVSLLVRSPVEVWTTPGLRFERLLTLYRGSTRVRVAQTLINESATTQRWGVWDVTQHIVHHPGESDFDNFWVYFPLNPASRYGEDGVRTSAGSDAWAGEVAAGVFGVRFRPDNRKIFADSHLGWVAYVDEREQTAYLKTFDVVDGSEYPDEGARVEVWVNRKPPYLEVEVLSPIVELAPGQAYTFVEEWWATRLAGPVLAVAPAGATTQRLLQRQGDLVGTYGVFHEGRVEVVYLDAAGGVSARGGTYQVSPQTPFTLRERRLGGERVELRLFAAAGTFVGLLDAADLNRITAVAAPPGAGPDEFGLGAAHPNPFNAGVVIPFRLPPSSRDVTLEIRDLAGRRVRTMKVEAAATATSWDGRDDAGREAATGVYIAVLRNPSGGQATVKLMLLR